MSSKKFLIILFSSLAALIVIGGIVFILFYPKLLGDNEIDKSSQPEPTQTVEVDNQQNTEPEPQEPKQPKEITDANLKIYIPDFAGDIIILVSKGEAMLINGGFKSDASSVLKYLETLGIKHFKYVVATNYHNDSVGGVAKILSKTSADYILLSNNVVKHRNSKEVLDFMTKQGLIWTSPSASTNISLGDVKVLFLTTHQEGSLVSVVKNKEETYVFSSSITNFDEQVLTKLPEDVNLLSITEVNSEYKLHEGVAEKLRPKQIIINDKEGLTLSETLNTVKPYDSQVYKLTDTSNITIISNGQESIIKPTKPKK